MGNTPSTPTTPDGPPAINKLAAVKLARVTCVHCRISAPPSLMLFDGDAGQPACRNVVACSKRARKHEYRNGPPPKRATPKRRRAGE